MLGGEARSKKMHDRQGVAACMVLLAASLATAQQPDQTETLKQENQMLAAKLEAANLKLEKLASQVEAQKKEIAELKKGVGAGKGAAKNAAKVDAAPDPLALGSSWQGTLDGKDATGKPFHQLATAVVTARELNSVQLRVTINDDLEWVYDLEREKVLGQRDVYRISNAQLVKAPPGFPTSPGNVRIGSSEMQLERNGRQRQLQLQVIRPVGKSGVNATYTWRQAAVPKAAAGMP
jgi:hypothetical protein